MESLVKKLESRIAALEVSGKPQANANQKPAANQQQTKAQPKKEEPKKQAAADDDDLDLFGSDVDEEAEELKRKRVEEYAAKKSKSNFGSLKLFSKLFLV